MKYPRTFALFLSVGVLSILVGLCSADLRLYVVGSGITLGALFAWFMEA